jgi:hypothetical protein
MITEDVKTTVQKFGWLAKENETGLILLANKKGVEVAKIRVKGKSYTIFDSLNNKLLSGCKSLAYGVEMVISEYFFGKPLKN